MTISVPRILTGTTRSGYAARVAAALFAGAALAAVPLAPAQATKAPPSLAALKAAVAGLEKEPSTILSAALGSFHVKPGGYIYLVSCDLSIEGCHLLANGVKTGAAALGYKFNLCNGGTTSQVVDACWTNAVNAKPSVIIADGNGIHVAGAGYAAAKKAGIPIVGLFTSNPRGYTNAEVANTVCAQEGTKLAEALVAYKNGKANVLFAGDISQQCDINRWDSFKPEFKAVCPSCGLTYLQFDYNTMTQTLPSQIQAALVRNPKINVIVGVNDNPASIADTEVTETGKAGTIIVAGMDGVASNVELVREHHVQMFDLAEGQAEDGWAADDVAARIYSGVKYPWSVSVNSFLETTQNVRADLPASGPSANAWSGPPNFQKQFEHLWVK